MHVTIACMKQLEYALRYLQKPHCATTGNMSSNKTYLQFRFVFKKELKSKVRRINLKLILLNQLK